jgi:hypothetical protein
MILMATSGKQLSSLPSASSIAGNNEFLTWVGNDTAQKVSRDDFIKSLPTYRQPSTIYTVGDIKYHSALPTGWYLECTTEGTSGSGDLTISSSSLGYTVNDGSVVWHVKNFISSFPNIDTDNGFSFNSGIDDINTVNLPGTKMITYRKTKASTGNKPESESYGGILNIYNTQYNTAVEKWTNSTTGNEFIRSMFAGGEDIGKWNAWKQQEQIVAKSLGTNGYIKYASGLVMQWGVVGFTESGSKEVSLPIGFSTSYIITTGSAADSINDIPRVSAFPSYSDGLNKFTVQSSRANNVNWFAIGY